MKRATMLDVANILRRHLGGDDELKAVLEELLDCESAKNSAALYVTFGRIWKAAGLPPRRRPNEPKELLELIERIGCEHVWRPDTPHCLKCGWPARAEEQSHVEESHQTEG